jgi:hypothetical protein
MTASEIRTLASVEAELAAAHEQLALWRELVAQERREKEALKQAMLEALEPGNWDGHRALERALSVTFA